MNILSAVANFILPGIFKEVDKAIPDQDLGAKLKASIQTAVLSADAQALQEQAGIVTAEAQGESWLQRNWRPVTMMGATTTGIRMIITPISLTLVSPINTSAPIRFNGRKVKAISISSRRSWPMPKPASAAC